MSAPDVVRPDADSRRHGRESLAAVLTVVGLVLLGAPLGLLWAELAPPVEVVAGAGGSTELADPTRDSFIAVDGAFLVLVLLVGLVTGALAWRLGRRHGLGVVVGLAVGGLLAAEVARRTGQLVDAGRAQARIDEGYQGLLTLPVQLRSPSARAGWPVAALAAHMVLTVLEGRTARAAPTPGSGPPPSG